MIESDTTNNLKHNQPSNAQRTSFKMNKEKKILSFLKTENYNLNSDPTQFS